MTDPAPSIDLACLPAPAEGILVSLFVTVRHVARSSAPDKPGITVADHVPGSTTSIFLNPARRGRRD